MKGDLVMKNEKMIEFIENQITKLEKLQEEMFCDSSLVLEISNSIRQHVDLLRSINVKLKQW